MNDLILLESVSARNSAIANLTHDRATEHLNKAKALVMAMWQGTGVATTRQMAEYFEVNIEAVQSTLSENKEEFAQEWLLAVINSGDKIFETRSGRNFLLYTVEGKLQFLQENAWVDLLPTPSTPVVYFILDTVNKLIKIGFTKSIEARFNCLQTGNAHTLKLLGLCDGGRCKELSFHKQFASYRVRGEWFKDCKEIRDCIAVLPPLEPVVTQEGFWTPRAALRLGMLLRDSAIAKQVRTLLLDLAQVVPQQQEHIRELELRLALAQVKVKHNEL